MLVHTVPSPTWGLWSLSMLKEKNGEPTFEGLVLSTLFREFAAEYMELARKSPSLEQRMVYLNMASAWHHTAVRWETDFHRRKLRKDPA